MLKLVGVAARSARMLGLGRLLPEVRDQLDKLCMRLGRPPLTIKYGDFRMSGYLRHRILLAQIANGVYEPFSLELCRSCILPGTLVVDGGAHIGVFTVTASKATGQSGTVLAFEPSAYNYVALVHNIRNNGLLNVQPFRKALAAGKASGTFHEFSGTISHSLVDRSGVGPARRVPVELIAVDNEARKIDYSGIFLKLDLEGAETLALDGAAESVARGKYAVALLEANPGPLRDAASSPQELVAKLHRLGFDTYFVEEAPQRLLPVASGAPVDHGNLFCTRGSLPPQISAFVRGHVHVR